MPQIALGRAVGLCGDAGEMSMHARPAGNTAGCFGNRAMDFAG